MPNVLDKSDKVKSSKVPSRWYLLNFKIQIFYQTDKLVSMTLEIFNLKVKEKSWKVCLNRDIAKGAPKKIRPIKIEKWIFKFQKEKIVQ